MPIDEQNSTRDEKVAMAALAAEARGLGYKADPDTVHRLVDLDMVRVVGGRAWGAIDAVRAIKDKFPRMFTGVVGGTPPAKRDHHAGLSALPPVPALAQPNAKIVDGIKNPGLMKVPKRGRM